MGREQAGGANESMSELGGGLGTRVSVPEPVRAPSGQVEKQAQASSEQIREPARWPLARTLGAPYKPGSGRAGAGTKRRVSAQLSELIRRSALADLVAHRTPESHKYAHLGQQAHPTNSPTEPLVRRGHEQQLRPASFHHTSTSGLKRLALNLSLQFENSSSSKSVGNRESKSRLGHRANDGQQDRDVDGGYAWVVLAVVFVINASTFGTARAYGLIFNKLVREDDKSRTEAAMPFTVMGAIENMAGPLSGYLLAHSRGSWRLTVFAGSCLITLAHLLAALTTDSQPGQLLSMGLMCGIGLSLVSLSFFQLNNAYFVRYRSTAFGLGMTGAALGTLYISPLCQYFLDNHGTSACYLMLSAILLPNVPLSLLLKPKGLVGQQAASEKSFGEKSSPEKTMSNPCEFAGPTLPAQASSEHDKPTAPTVTTISQQVSELEQLARRKRAKLGAWSSVRRVICNPLFHLIWPTQLLFCWLNFVFGMIIVDFGKDRGLNAEAVSHLVPCWAFGQLVGRLFLSYLVDLKCLSYKSFTVICFFVISLTTWLLNNIRLATNATAANNEHWWRQAALLESADHLHVITLALVFVLSMFIALLYILLNGLVVRYVEPTLQPLSIGISSFTGSFFLLPRANIIGHYRDTIGNYDDMLTMFSLVSLLAASIWLLLPPACTNARRLLARRRSRPPSPPLRLSQDCR